MEAPGVGVGICEFTCTCVQPYSEASSPDAHTHTACLLRDDAAFSPESVVAIISTLFLAIVAFLSDI